MMWPPQAGRCFRCRVRAPLEEPGNWLRRAEPYDERAGGRPLLRVVSFGLHERAAHGCVDQTACAERLAWQARRMKGLAP